MKNSATNVLFIATATTKGMPNTKRKVSVTTDRMLEEPCEATSLTHGFEAERRGRPLRLGNQVPVVDGWEFRLVNDHLLITSQSDSTKEVQLSPHAAFALLNYLSQHKDTLYWVTQQGQRDEAEHDWREPFSDVEASEG